MDPIILFKQTNFSKTIWWKLKSNISGYKDELNDNLVTEILKNRLFRVLSPKVYRICFNVKSRILIQLFEDGYICWVNFDQLEIERTTLRKGKINRNEQLFIQSQIPAILNWILWQSYKPNTYKWGGTFGPNFDCSGLIQTAFMKKKIYLPRDAYQMRNFCKHLFRFPNKIDSLRMGDLIFFGNKKRVDHVGIYFKNGFYFHSSGREFGRNGIALDCLLDVAKEDNISKYYKSQLNSAGRIIRSYRWDQTIR
tara:strand:+ start:3013 stop:3768 length:756 start_codon:yes stop_codon:yes gene_type:complete